jgi:hypothetical protein
MALRRGAGVREGGRAARPHRRAVARAAPAVDGREQPVGGDRDVDILAVKVAGGRACVNLAMVRGSRHLGDRAYFPAHVDDGAALPPRPKTTTPRRPSGRSRRAREEAVLEAFIAQHYLGQAVPPLLVTSHAVDPRCWRRWRSRGRARARAAPAARAAPHLAGDGGQGRRARAGAAAGRGRLAAAAHARAGRGAGPGHRRPDACASSVSTSATPPAKRRRPPAWSLSSTDAERQYRRFNIEGITGGDDYAAMRQVLTRRYAKAGRGRSADERARRCRWPTTAIADAAAAPQRATRRRQARASQRACPTWCWWTAARPGGDGARGVRGTGPGPGADRRRREGRRPQGRARGTGVRRRPPQGVSRA